MIQSYFESEKKAGFFALSIGLIACSVASAFMISARPAFYIGLSMILLAIGIIQIIVGVTLARRSDFQARDLQLLLGNDADEYVQLELPRMEKIMRSFKLFKWLELLFILIGLALFFMNEELVFSKGLGTGLVLQMVIMLIFDYFAEKRAKNYLQFIVGVNNDSL